MKTNKEIIVKATEESTELLRKMSHEFHVLFGEVTDTFGKTEMKLRDDLLKFTEKILQTIGIFAGFGFTGIVGVKSIYFFICGEAFLISAILYGISKVKNIHASSLESVQKSFDNKYLVFNKKSKIFQRVIPAFLREGKMNATKFQNEIDEADRDILKAFEEKPKPVDKNEGSFLNKIIVLAIIGAVILLISFTDIPKVIFGMLKL